MRRDRRLRCGEDPASEGGSPGCLDCPLLNLWKQVKQLQMFSGCLKGVEEDDDDSDVEHAAQRPAGLDTDADMGSLAAGERTLQEVDTSWVSGTEDLLLKGGAGKLDQFAANERLFNVKSTFDESLYTSPLDKTCLSREQMADAERMAAETESKPSNNIHIREERNMAKKSSLRASANKWKLNPAAPEWKPAASFAPPASWAIAPTICGHHQQRQQPAQGHHQMYMQPPPAGIRMPMAPGQLQGYPQEDMHMMGQPGNPVPPPESPFFHGQMQMAQQQEPQQQQQQPRGFPMLQGYPWTGPAPGPPHDPPQPQRPGMMDMGGGVYGGGRMGGGNNPHDHGGDEEGGEGMTWSAAATLEEAWAEGILEEVDFPAKTARSENNGAEAWTEWTR